MQKNLFIKNGPTLAFFSFILDLSKETIIFYNKSMWKNVMPIQYMAAGFEPTTSPTWVVSHNHKTRAPTAKNFSPWVCHFACPLLQLLMASTQLSDWEQKKGWEASQAEWGGSWHSKSILNFVIFLIAIFSVPNGTQKKGSRPFQIWIFQTGSNLNPRK